MYRTCFRLISNHEDTEDVLQEAFVRAFRQLKKLRDPEQFGSWLKAIVINCSMTFIKRKHRLTWISLQDIHPEEMPEEEETVMPDPEVVMQEINRLPAGCRAIILLYMVEGYKQQEIAKLMNLSLSTVKSQYQRGKSMLKERIKEHQGYGQL